MVSFALRRSPVSQHVCTHGRHGGVASEGWVIDPSRNMTHLLTTAPQRHALITLCCSVAWAVAKGREAESSPVQSNTGWAAEPVLWRTVGIWGRFCALSPFRYLCTGDAYARLFVFICLAAAEFPSFAFSALEWVTALCFSVEKMSGIQSKGGWLHLSLQLTTAPLKHPALPSEATSLP